MSLFNVQLRKNKKLPGEGRVDIPKPRSSEQKFFTRRAITNYWSDKEWDSSYKIRAIASERKAYMIANNKKKLPLRKLIEHGHITGWIDPITGLTMDYREYEVLTEIEKEGILF